MSICFTFFWLGGEVFEHVDSDVHADSRDSEEMAMKTAEKLLKVFTCSELYKLIHLPTFYWKRWYGAKPEIKVFKSYGEKKISMILRFI